MYDDLDGFVDVDVCARRMNISQDKVIELVRIRALRAYDLGWPCGIQVEPAIVSGAVTA